MINLNRPFIKKGYILLFILIFQGCLTLDVSEIRSQFLPPVNYTGGICRVSTQTANHILSPRPSATDMQLARKIARLLAKSARYYSFSIQDPESGLSIQWNDTLLFHAASTYKAAILLALMKMDQDKKISIHHTIEIKNHFSSIVDGSEFSVQDDTEKPDILFSKLESKIEVKKVIQEMIAHSSNLATNLLIDYFGTQNINETLRNMGSKIEVLRGVSDSKAYSKCINNLVSASSLNQLYQKIYDETVFDAVHRKKIIEILETNDRTDQLPAKLPEDIHVAHKPGNTSKVFHDAGIIILPDKKPYFITLLASGYKSERKTAKAIAQISKITYEAVIAARARSENSQSQSTKLSSNR